MLHMNNNKIYYYNSNYDFKGGESITRITLASYLVQVIMIIVKSIRGNVLVNSNENSLGIYALTAYNVHK